MALLSAPQAQDPGLQTATQKVATRFEPAWSATGARRGAITRPLTSRALISPAAL